MYHIEIRCNPKESAKREPCKCAQGPIHLRWHDLFMPRNYLRLEVTELRGMHQDIKELTPNVEYCHEEMSQAHGTEMAQLRLLNNLG